MMLMVPAPAKTAGIVKTPVPTILPTTSPVAEVSPMARDLSRSRAVRGGPGDGRAADAPGVEVIVFGSGTTEELILLP